MSRVSSRSRGSKAVRSFSSTCDASTQERSDGSSTRSPRTKTLSSSTLAVRSPRGFSATQLAPFRRIVVIVVLLALHLTDEESPRLIQKLGGILESSRPAEISGVLDN